MQWGNVNKEKVSGWMGRWGGCTEFLTWYPFFFTLIPILKRLQLNVLNCCVAVQHKREATAEISVPFLTWQPQQNSVGLRMHMSHPRMLTTYRYKVMPLQSLVVEKWFCSFFAAFLAKLFPVHPHCRYGTHTNQGRMWDYGQCPYTYYMRMM